MKQRVRSRFFIAAIFSVLSHVTAFVFLLPLFAAWELIKGLVRDENESLKVALLLAILVHLALILPMVHTIITLQEDRTTDEPVLVDLWQGVVPPEPEKTPEEELAEYEPEAEIPDGQVVRVPESEDHRKPDDARFLAERRPNRFPDCPARADWESRDRRTAGRRTRVFSGSGNTGRPLRSAAKYLHSDRRADR